MRALEYVRLLRHGALCVLIASASALSPGTLRAQPIATARWIRPFPSPHASAALVADVVRDRVIMFGGAEPGVRGSGVWSHPLQSGTSWEELPTTGTPPSLQGRVTGMLDQKHDRMLVLWTYPSVSSGLWALSLAGIPTWSAIPTTGSTPGAREGAAALMDPVRDRILMYGGGRLDLPEWRLTDDVWTLPLSGPAVWSRLVPPVGTSPVRYAACAVLDSRRNRMILIGGSDSTGSFHSDVWALSLAEAQPWDSLAPSGEPPAGHNFAAATYDSLHDTILLHGGQTATGVSTELYQLQLSPVVRWVKPLLGSAATSPRVGHAAVQDTRHDRMVCYGGTDGLSALGDLVAADLSSGQTQWVTLAEGRVPPRARGGASAVLDPIARRMILVGGWLGFNWKGGDVHALSLSAPPSWQTWAPSGSALPPRTDACEIFDSASNRVIIHGGFDANIYSDTWELRCGDHPAWARLTTVGLAPPARWGASAVYDALRGRMLVYGGVCQPDVSTEVWQLRFTTPPEWSRLTTAGPLPPTRVLHTAVMDVARDRMLVFGGSYADSNEVWALSLTEPPTWSHLVTSGARPRAGQGAFAAIDAQGDRMLLVASGDPVAPGVPLEVWALSLSGTPTWSRIVTSGGIPPTRSSSAAVFDPRFRRLMVFGGFETTVDQLGSDLWQLDLDATLSTDPGDQPIAMTPRVWASPNPTRGAGTTLNVRTEQADILHATVMDVSGRMVRTLSAAAATPGIHQLHWDGRDAKGKPIAPGVYLIRLAGSGFDATTRVVRLP